MVCWGIGKEWFSDCFEIWSDDNIIVRRKFGANLPVEVSISTSAGFEHGISLTGAVSICRPLSHRTRVLPVIISLSFAVETRASSTSFSLREAVKNSPGRMQTAEDVEEKSGSCAANGSRERSPLAMMMMIVWCLLAPKKTNA